MPRIIVAASVNMDIVARTDHHPRAGETVAGSELRYIPGGKGANQATAAARLGGDVTVIGKVGDDNSGASLKAFLNAENLDTQHVTIAHDTPSGTALIVVDSASENTIVIIAGANSKLAPADLDGVAIHAGDIVVTQFEIPLETVSALFQKAKANQATTVLNAAPARACPPELLTATDYLLVNETELAFFAKSDSVPQTEDDIVTAAKKLRVREDQTIVVTLGAKGAVCVHGDSLIAMAGYNVKAIDTTAAGDCFVGAFAVGLAEAMQLDEALNFANAAAALSVQTLGASSSLPKRDDVTKFIIKQLKGA
jgi:ribokinase